MEKSFTTLEELQAEIALLRLKRSEQEVIIQERFDGPMAIFKTITSLFKSSKKDAGGDDKEDMVSMLSRVFLPILLNSSVFRKSNFLVKTLVTMFSQKAAKNVNMDVVSGVVDKVTSLFKRKAGKTDQDYGIPPDSETY